MTTAFLNVPATEAMHPFYTICILCMVVSVTYESMNIGLFIKKAEEEYSIKEEVYVAPSPPPHEEAARMARYIVHNSGVLDK